MSTDTTNLISDKRAKLMRHRWLWSVVILCLLLLGTKVIHHALQPRYQGKTAEQWFEEVDHTVNDSMNSAADPAVIGLKHLGTNAVWALWREVQQKESPLMVSFQKQLARITGKPDALTKQQRRMYTAWLILWQYGPETEVLLPEALTLLKNGSPTEAAFAASLLGTIHRQPERVVPALLQSLTLTNRSMDQRISHIIALKEFGPAAKDALPYLRTRFADPKCATTAEAHWLAKAILTINGPGPELDFLTKNLLPGHFLESYTAISMLDQLGTNARPTAPALFQFAQTLTNQVDSNRVMEVIRKIDPEGVYATP